jgi:hypothetical protein
VEEPPPEPEEVLVEEEVEVITPRADEDDPEDLLQRIKNLDVTDEE